MEKIVCSNKIQTRWIEFYWKIKFAHSSYLFIKIYHQVTHSLFTRNHAKINIKWNHHPRHGSIKWEIEFSSVFSLIKYFGWKATVWQLWAGKIFTKSPILKFFVISSVLVRYFSLPASWLIPLMNRSSSGEITWPKFSWRTDTFWIKITDIILYFTHNKRV